MDKRIESRLNQVAQDGDIKALYELIREDVKILEDIDKLPFVNTPLHITASVDSLQPKHIKFAMEMMRLKPSFARKPNPDGFSPIHLALQKALRSNESIKLVHPLQMVRRLLKVDGDLVHVKGRNGITPLHVAAEGIPLRDESAAAATAEESAAAATKQQLDLLVDFLSVCPNSIEDVTIENKTALHIALESNKLEAFKLLVGWLRRNKPKNAMSCENDILNWKDEEGNTVLHVAVSKNQSEASPLHSSIIYILKKHGKVFVVNVYHESKTSSYFFFNYNFN